MQGHFERPVREAYEATSELVADNIDYLKGLRGGRGIPYAVVHGTSALGTFDTRPTAIKKAGMEMFLRTYSTIKNILPERERFGSQARSDIPKET